MIKNGDQLSGISLNIWRRVAEDNNLSYELLEQPSPKAGIEAVDDGEIDVLVGPISITSRRLAMPRRSPCSSPVPPKRPSAFLHN